MKFAFSNIGAGDPTKNRVPNGNKPVPESRRKKENIKEITADEKKLPLFYTLRIKPPKYEYY